MIGDGPRRRTLVFTHTPDAGTIQALASELQKQTGVNSAVFTDGQLVLEYMFPDISFERLLREIDRHNGLPPQRLLYIVKNNILAFMETNERDGLLYASGWHRYVEDVYLHYFQDERDERIDIRKQTWRKYK